MLSIPTTILITATIMVLFLQNQKPHEPFDYINFNHTKNNGITTTSTRIIGGTTAHWAKSYPWFVRLDKNHNSTNTCGGSLITKDCVLTAAHCVEDIKPTQVRIGQDELRNVSKVIMHPNFRKTPKKAVSDIALIFLEKPSSKTPVRLLSSVPKKGTDVTIIGFGKDAPWTKEEDELNQKNPNAYYGVKDLQKTRLKVTDFKNCGTIQMNNDTKGSVKIKTLLDFTCLTSPSSGACNGDSGGPVILWKNDIPYVFGVTSFGIPGCRSYKKYGYSVLYTDVTQYDGWIRQNVRKYGKHSLRS